MRAAPALLVAGIALATILAAVPAQAQPPPGPDPTPECAFHPHPAVRRPADEHDEHLVHDANRCAQDNAGRPLPARGDADAACNDGPYLVPDCVAEAQARCAFPGPPSADVCDPVAGTTAWVNASALAGYCLDCSAALQVTAHHENLTHSHLQAEVVWGLYRCQVTVGPEGSPPADAPLPRYGAEAGCLPGPDPGLP